MDTAMFSALAEPNRLHIVELLQEGPLTVGEVAGRLELRQPQASKHLKVLLEAGLVDVRAEANKRTYRLRGEAFQELEQWLIICRRGWEARFDRLDDYLGQLQAQNRPKD
ncbi:helix-turn-helix transcriptional regulator [Paenibacillus sp. NFR01]|uniref:ArsR/SmtB family transcription factor n=1 Tax=Paenibacillus sp. NFR01 TaxID=1566279 RepID=UPI000B8211CF|nr:metalloregulator ArsR/SmtB family transcription factor [Paenibacillus sp. NFR01]